MRNRRETIAALRRLAERPGAPAEGETARRLLAQFGAGEWVPKPFDASLFPAGTRVFYCYWCYRNDTGIVCKQTPRMQRGYWWMRIKFDRLKQPRWVPITSRVGCHIGLQPFTGREQEILYRLDADWESFEKSFMDFMKARGIEYPKAFVENAPQFSDSSGAIRDSEEG